MKKFNASEPAVSPELSSLAAESQALLKSHVSSFTRKDGAFVAEHEDKRAAAQAKPAAGGKPAAAPGIGAQAQALRDSTEPGHMDHETNQIAADHMEGGHTDALKATLRAADTMARDHVLDHIHPDHWEGLGFNPLNKEKSVKEHDAKFGAKPADAPAAKPGAFEQSKRLGGTPGSQSGKPAADAGKPATDKPQAAAPAADQPGAGAKPDKGQEEFHSAEGDAHSAASIRALQADDVKGERAHDKAVSAHDAAARAHRTGAADASALTDTAAKASQVANDLFDREKPKAKAPAGPAEGEIGHEEHKDYGKHFKKGDKVTDGSGNPHEVVDHHGPVVRTTSGGSFHPTKLDFADGSGKPAGKPMAKALLFTSAGRVEELLALSKSHIAGFTRKDGAFVKQHDNKVVKRVEAHGVKGMKSTPWRKEFKSEEHFAQWAEKDGGDHQVLGVREMDEPAAAAPALPGPVGAAVNSLAPSEWTHKDGESHHAAATRYGSRGLGAHDVLGDNGFKLTETSAEADTFTHPDGHVATLSTTGGLTIKHGKKG